MAVSEAEHFRSLREPVIITGRDCKTITFASEEACRLFGYERMEGMNAKSLYEIRYERQRIVERLTFAKRLETHVFLRKSNNENFYATIELYLLQEDEKITGTAGITKLFENIDSENQRTSMKLKRLTMLEKLMDKKEKRLAGHSERVGELCKDITEVMGVDGQASLRSRYYGGKLHDLGKLLIEDKALSEDTRFRMDDLLLHPELGVKLLKGIEEYRDDPIIRDCVLYHHERYDGKGYPNRLQGKEIPIAGRITAVADAFDAICSRRGFNVPRDPEEALSEIRKDKGTHFCPEVVEAFEISMTRTDAKRYYEHVLSRHQSDEIEDNGNQQACHAMAPVDIKKLA